MEERGYITLRSHIEKIMSERTGMDIDKVKDNVDYIIDRLHSMSKEDNVFKIYLSDQLGELLCTRKTIYYKRKRVKEKKTVEYLNRKLKILEENRDQIYSGKIKKLTKQNIKKRFLNSSYSQEELERIQNNIYEEYKERFE